MNPVLRSFWAQQSRFKVLHGGRASSKSWDTAAQAIRIAQTVKVRVLCARQFQNKIEESVYTLLIMQIERFGLRDRFLITKSKIVCLTTGSEFIFYGIARNIAEIKGLEGIDILWIEEAENINKEDYGILEATVRNEGSEIWIIFNPRFESDFVYQNFVVDPPPTAQVRQINYDENPFLSATAMNDVVALRKKDYDEYLHRYMGVPKSDDDRTVIKRTWLESAVDAHIKLGIEPSGYRRVGFDVADDGADLNALASAHGQLCHKVNEWKGFENELLKSCSRVYMEAVTQGASIDYDSIGVGASAGAKFNELNELNGTKVLHRKFNAGGAVVNPKHEYMPGVKNKDHFSNLKAQAWWTVADRLRATHAAVVNGEPFDEEDVICISSEIEKIEGLITELSTPFRDFNTSGKVKVESKEDLAKRNVKSPNRADGFVMAFSPIHKGSSFEWYVSGGQA